MMKNIEKELLHLLLGCSVQDVDCMVGVLKAYCFNSNDLMQTVDASMHFMPLMDKILNYAVNKVIKEAIPVNEHCRIHEWEDKDLYIDCDLENPHISIRIDGRWRVAHNYEELVNFFEKRNDETD